MFGLLFILGGILLTIYFVSRQPKNDQTHWMVDQQLQQRNYEWAQFIAQYITTAHTKSQRELISRMLSDIASRGLAVPDISAYLHQQPPDGESAEPASAQLETTPPQYVQQQETYQYAPQQQPVYAQPPTPATQVNLDNTSLLLYFGAFLFVASAGLFVAFGGLPGVLRAATVLIVSQSLYWGGIWLLKHRAKLSQAAYAFVGIGMTITPLTGLAAYAYIFNNTHGSAVWLVTSVVCAVLYAQALYSLRSSLIGYVFIFTLLSLFESGISLINFPLYYYGWAMAIMGLAMRLISHLQKNLAELQEPAERSAQLFIPLAVAVSLVVLPTQGVGQFGVSLLIASLYYAVEAFIATDKARLTLASVSQISALLGITMVTYAASHSWTTTGMVMVGTTLFQAALIRSLPRESPLWQNFASVALAAQVVALAIGLGYHTVLGASLGALVILGCVTWLYQRRADAYVVATLAWISLPLAIGLLVIEPALPITSVVPLALAALLVQFATHLHGFATSQVTGWETAAKFSYAISVAVVVIASLFSPWWCLATCVIAALTMLYLAHAEQDHDWLSVGGLIAAAPMLLVFSGDTPKDVLLAANLFALLCNVYAALRFRCEANRWYFTVLWMLLPLTLGDGVLGERWHAVEYAVAYLVVAAGMVLSRAIARGTLMASSKVPLASYTKTASLSYVLGYCLPLSISMLAALFFIQDRVIASSIIAAIGAVVWFVARNVEKQPQVYVVLPLIAQALWWSISRPADVKDQMITYTLISTAISAGLYALATTVRVQTPTLRQLADGALLATTITPLTALFTEQVYWPAPVGMLVGSILFYERIRRLSQDYREWAGALILAAVYWCMWHAGIHNLQAYTHMLAALFAGYAYWRYKRAESHTSDQYVWCALATATVPLLLQAIAGVAGGLYGWWLLLEQITFMLIGMAIHRRFMTMWGLYVAVGAVIYQLRSLGWAALTVLAVFLIGLAIYQLQKKPQP